MVSKQLTIVNAQGFHMRPAQMFTAAMAKYSSDVIIKFNGNDVNGKSLLNIIPACIKCGGCIDHCPMSLMPMEIERAYENKDGALLKALKVNLCMECGCCAFQCPANRPLVQVNKLAKTVLREYEAKLKAEQEALKG